MFITFIRFYPVTSHKSKALINLGVAIPLRFYKIGLILCSKQHNFKNTSKGVYLTALFMQMYINYLIMAKKIGRNMSQCKIGIKAILEAVLLGTYN